MKFYLHFVDIRCDKVCRIVWEKSLTNIFDTRAIKSRSCEKRGKFYVPSMFDSPTTSLLALSLAWEMWNIKNISKNISSTFSSPSLLRRNEMKRNRMSMCMRKCTRGVNVWRDWILKIFILALMYVTPFRQRFFVELYAWMCSTCKAAHTPR